MKKSPLVSIGVPVYNGARSIRRTLDALLGQTYQNFEILISDNASTDETQKICLEYVKKDRRIRYVRQKTNSEGVPNFNFLLQEMRGDYFVWAASDDFLGKQFLEKCMEKFLRDPELSMVFCRFERFDEKSGERHAYTDASLYLPTERNIYERLKHHVLLYLSDGKAGPIYGLWDRKKIGNYRCPFNRFYIGFDVNFIFRNLTKGPCAVVEETLLFKSADFSNPLQGGIVFRIFHALIYRLGIIFSPMFFLNIGYALAARGLPVSQKIKLVYWNFFVMARLFFQRKI